jgi:hypothetical protein
MPRPIRILAASIAACALVFAQLAVSAFVCPGQDGQAALERMSEAGCPDLDPANLCQQHCNYGEASVDSAKPLPGLAQTASAVLWFPATLAAPHSLVPPGHIVPATGPPPLTLFGALRI